jgi:hypothetical protein
MMQPPRQASGRTRAINVSAYPAAEIAKIAAFISSYSENPQPETLPWVFDTILARELHRLPEHTYGIAGMIEGLAHHHPEMVPDWQKRWPELTGLAVKLRPSEVDHEIVRVGEIDYLWMVALVMGEDALVDRLVRLGLRRDAVGDAAVQVLTANAEHPIVGRALARAVTTAPPTPPEHIPAAAVRDLAAVAAADPAASASVLLVYWQARSDSAPAAFVVVSRDGLLPRCMPRERGGFPVLSRTATAQERAHDDRLGAQRNQP